MERSKKNPARPQNPATPASPEDDYSSLYPRTDREIRAMWQKLDQEVEDERRQLREARQKARADWFQAMKDGVESLYLAAEDATRLPSQRVMSRRSARKSIRDAVRSLREMLAKPPFEVPGDGR